MSLRPKRQFPVTRFGEITFHKLNTQKWEWRDAYHWLLTLSWPQFSAFVFGMYLAINLLFSLCYYLRPHSIAGSASNSWSDCFFFSVETLATVGYGHMYPETLFGHVVATLEIMIGMFGMAIITGLIFIRFSRPIARIVFSNNLVLDSFDGQPALMFRVANLRDQAMAEAEFRLMLMRDEPTKEGENFRRFYPLKLQFDRLISFPAIITIRHIIDQQSPLQGLTLPDMQRDDSRFSASIVCIDTVIPAPVQSHHAYTWKDILVNHQFVEVYNEIEDNALTVDYGRIHATEPRGTVRPA
ncbi:MAG TPA: ion channel [Verrucomicrobiae bacterium]|nr:ion channel [Verrucomicrobiae bacterium]